MLILTQRRGFVKRFSRFPPGNSPIFPFRKNPLPPALCSSWGSRPSLPTPCPLPLLQSAWEVTSPQREGETILYISFQRGDKPPFVSPRKGKGPLATPLRGGAPVSAPASVGPGRCPPGTRTPLAPSVRARSSLAYYKKGFQRGIKSPFEKLSFILKIEISLPRHHGSLLKRAICAGGDRGVGCVTAQDRKIPLGSARRNFVASTQPSRQHPFRHRSAMTPS